MTSAATRRRIEGPRAERPEPTPAEMDDRALLRKFAELTHRIHEADRQGRSEQYAFQRDQRALIEAEALRRMGGQ